MPTVGNDVQYTDGAEWWGVNVDNQHAVAYTMPEDGTITQIGVWIRGKDASCSFKGVVWDSTRNTVLGQTATQTASGAALSIGASIDYLANVVTPFDVASGATIYIGFCRNPSGAMQFDFDNSSSHYDDDNGSSNPSGMTSETLHSGRKFASYAVYEVGAAAYVRRSLAWVKNDEVYVRRTAAWSAVGAEVYVRRSGAWVKAT